MDQWLSTCAKTSASDNNIIVVTKVMKLMIVHHTIINWYLKHVISFACGYNIGCWSETDGLECIH